MDYTYTIDPGHHDGDSVSTKKPQLGDYIVHKEPSFDRENEGKVIELLGMQFVYETAAGDQRFCLYKESWRKIDEKSGETA